MSEQTEWPVQAGKGKDSTDLVRLLCASPSAEVTYRSVLGFARFPAPLKNITDDCLRGVSGVLRKERFCG